MDWIGDWSPLLMFVVIAVVIVVSLVNARHEARHRALLAASREAEWKTMVAKRDGDVKTAAIDYRAEFGSWPGDWNRF